MRTYSCAIRLRPAITSMDPQSSSSRIRPSSSKPAGVPRSPTRTICCSNGSYRSSAPMRSARDADPVMLEVFNNLFMSIAEQMGVSLQNTAYSVNIKERLDFSCAVFAADGTLVANAPHMPVHLGSMDRAVETIIRENAGAIAPGDVYAINAPYNGGTHLPDITVCTPVFDDGGARDPVLGCKPWTPRRRRRYFTRLDVAERDDDRGGRRLHRQFQAGRRRSLLRAGAARSAHRRQISGTQPGSECQRPESADRRQREGRAGAAQDGDAIHATGGAGLHGARAGQRGRKRAPRDRRVCATV